MPAKIVFLLLALVLLAPAAPAADTEESSRWNSFILAVTNKCTTPIQLAIGFEGGPGIDAGGGMKLFATKTMAKGWWQIDPGTTREILIDHALESSYFTHARNDAVFWGKDKLMEVRMPDGAIKVVKFTKNDTENCKVDPQRRLFYCSNSYTCQTSSKPE